MKKLFSLLLALLVVISLAVPAFAASDAVITVKNKSLFDYEVESQYTSTDLFNGFKDVLPGDKISQTVVIKNQSYSSDYIKVYLKAVPHDETDNPLTYSETFENTDGKDQAGVAGQRDETVATMEVFLSQLTLRVFDKNDKLIYEAFPDKTGGLKSNVYLGSLRRWKSMKLTVELDVPAELGNEYASRVGEVDWVFTIESRNDPSDSPKTGDYLIMGAVGAMALSAAALVILFIIRRKNKK